MVTKKYYSQDGQDKFILENIFTHQAKGLFVDIGANDGISFSNTYAFEQKGWTGYCVEPLDEVYESLVKNRPGSYCVNAIISDISGESEFLSIEGYCQMLSGELKKYDPQHLKRIDEEIAQYGGSKKLVTITSYMFDDLIKEKEIDYLSIDVEGGELDIIKSIDFEKYFIKVISIENNYGDMEMVNLIQSFGFQFVANLGRDNIFVNSKLLK